MSSSVSTHALYRAIQETSHGAMLSLEARQAQLGFDQLQETWEQHQIEIGGIASTGIDWIRMPVAFDTEFFFAPYQRDSPLSVPHFTPGAVVQGEPWPAGSAPDPLNPFSLVAVDCQVVTWALDHTTGAINGAVLGIAITLGATSTRDVAFDGYVHATFQGFGAPSENNVSLDVGQ